MIGGRISWTTGLDGRAQRLVSEIIIGDSSHARDRDCHIKVLICVAKRWRQLLFEGCEEWLPPESGLYTDIIGEALTLPNKVTCMQFELEHGEVLDTLQGRHLPLSMHLYHSTIWLV